MVWTSNFDNVSGAKSVRFILSFLLPYGLFSSTSYTIRLWQAWGLGRELWCLAVRLETRTLTRFSKWCGAVARNVRGVPETASSARSRPHPNSSTRPAAELQIHYFMAVATAACTSSTLRCLPQMFGPRICWLFFTTLKQQASRRRTATMYVNLRVHSCCYYTPMRGLDVTTCEIVEIAGMVERTKAKFASTVKPTNLHAAAASVNIHGIGVEEMQQSPPFPIVFGRFLNFLRDAADTSLAIQLDSDEEPDSLERWPILQCPAPEIVLAAHNGVRYDGPVIVHECARHGLSISRLSEFKWLDTLHVARACAVAPCLRLQCLVKGLAAEHQLCAHRALDDVLALEAMMRNGAELLSTPLAQMVQPFVLDFDAIRTLVDLSFC